jgi:flavodoxin
LSGAKGKSSFIFSTNGAPSKLANETMIESQRVANHKKTRKKLEGKGFEVIDDFSCFGFNTNSFIKIIGGLNKGRPNEEDLRDAELFAYKIKRKAELNRHVPR